MFDICNIQIECFFVFFDKFLWTYCPQAISNLETMVLGESFQAKLFPEICFCLVGTMFACGTIHRVCATTWYALKSSSHIYFDVLILFLFWIFSFLFSIFALYFVNKISQKTQTAAAPAIDAHTSSKKKRKWATTFLSPKA